MSIKTFSLITATALLAIASQSAAAQDMRLKFIGQVTNGTCDVRAGDANQTINLGRVLVSDLKPGNHRRTDHYIRVVNCSPSMKNAIFTFSGAASPLNNKNWKNEGTATGVDFKLVGAGANWVDLCPTGTGCVKSRKVAIVGGTAVTPLGTFYSAYAGKPVTPGTFEANVAVTMSYE